MKFKGCSFEHYILHQVKDKYGSELRLKSKYLVQCLKRGYLNEAEDRLVILRDILVRYTNPMYVYYIQQLIEDSKKEWDHMLNVFDNNKVMAGYMMRYLRKKPVETKMKIKKTKNVQASVPESRYSLRSRIKKSTV